MSNEALLEKALFKLFERALPATESEIVYNGSYLNEHMFSDEKAKIKVLERRLEPETGCFGCALLCKVSVGEFYFYCKLHGEGFLYYTSELVPKEEVEVDTILQSFVVDDENILAQCKVYNSSSTYWAILPNFKYNTTEVDLKKVKHCTLKEAINRLSDNNPLLDFIRKGGAPLVPNPNENYELQDSTLPPFIQYCSGQGCDQRFSVGNPLQDSWYQVR